MQRVALITYLYGEKSNSVSGLRTESWAKGLAAAGFEVVVFTRAWEYIKDIKAGEHMDSTDYAGRSTEGSGNLQIVYLPFKKSWEPGSVLLKKIYNSFLALTGRYSAEADITQWYSAIADEHARNPFTHFITSSHPFSSLILMHRIKKQFSDCITLADFRDYININLLNPSKQFSLFSKLIISGQQKWITHYAGNIDLITTASESISEKFVQVHKCRRVITICNGFEKDLFKDVQVTDTGKVFSISLVGTLYSYQDIDFMLTGITGFLNEQAGASDIMFNFIGVDYYPLVAKQIRDTLEPYKGRFTITERIQRDEAITVMKNSSILFYVGWKGWKGIYSGKIFEYLGAGKNILIAPNDGDVLEKLINYTRTGKLANTPGEMVSILNDWYEQWKINELAYFGIGERINEYTREAQAEKLIQFITTANRDTI